MGNKKIELLPSTAEAAQEVLRKLADQNARGGGAVIAREMEQEQSQPLPGQRQAAEQITIVEVPVTAEFPDGLAALRNVIIAGFQKQTQDLLVETLAAETAKHVSELVLKELSMMRLSHGRIEGMLLNLHKRIVKMQKHANDPTVIDDEAEFFKMKAMHQEDVAPKPPHTAGGQSEPTSIGVGGGDNVVAFRKAESESSSEGSAQSPSGEDSTS